MNKEQYNQLSKEVLDAAITVHKEMGPGLLESVYEHCLMKEFELRGIFVENQVAIRLIYKGYELNKRLSDRYFS